MNKNIIILILVGVVAVAALAWLVGGYGSTPDTAPLPPESTETVNGTRQDASAGTASVAPETFTIRRTTEGYEPREVTIHAGDTVTFVNDTDRPHWPASAVHPTHQVYPAFDPKRPISPDEPWSFTFDRAGTWKFHDHLQASVTGSIIVLAPEK